MYASQIHRILSKDKYASRNFVGVFASNEIPYVKGQSAIIVNTDTHDKEGSHWLAMYIQDEHTLDFFDSYGFPPSTYGPYIESYVHQFKHVKMNKKPFQSLSSNVCGQYCMYFLLKRCQGLSMDYILYLFNRNKNNDFIMYQLFKKRYGVKMIFRK